MATSVKAWPSFSHIKPLAKKAFEQEYCTHDWEYEDDRDNGDLCEEIYKCKLCGKRYYRELPD